MPVGYKEKFLIKKLARLEDEFCNANSIFQEGLRDVEKLFKNYYNIEENEPEQQQKVKQTPEQEIQTGESPTQNKKTETPEKLASPEVKKLYRQIALKTHPDKLLGMPEGEEKEKLKILFQNANMFMEKDDYASLAIIAIKLGIEVKQFSENDLKKVKEKINIIEEKIQQIEKTVIWKWIFEENKAMKDKLLKALFKFMYDKKNKSNPRS
tara:strand:+ start:2534 stop:3163 length:630 start_codon:yes stop_codon:yes gene_type:complete